MTTPKQQADKMRMHLDEAAKLREKLQLQGFNVNISASLGAIVYKTETTTL